MGTFWLGLKIGVGIAIGLLLVYYTWKELPGLPETFRAVRFHRAGFSWAEGPQGWLSRDPYNDDWIFGMNGTTECFDRPTRQLEAIRETLEQCIALGRSYREQMGF